MSVEAIEAVCCRVFGADAQAALAVELGAGMYKSAYRVAVAGQGRPVMLRVVPEPTRQFWSERQLMRNEYAFPSNATAQVQPRRPNDHSKS